MTRILTVDDSRSVRMIVVREMQTLGYEVEEAEDGEKGLAKLAESKFDLVILDVTMPILDGPGMLAKMREGGNQTPVLMLTSESKRSIITAIMKTGITDYILKPFKTEELRAKVFKALGVQGAGAGGDGGGASATPSASGAAADPSAAKVSVDILVIDDMENVQKRLRQLVPEELSLAGVLTAQAALSTCRDRAFRLILIDNDMPDVNSPSLMRQIRVLQPRAAILALYLRTNANVTDEAKKAGFDGILLKPFDAGSVEDLLGQHFNSQEIVTKSDNILKIAAFKGRDNKLDGYFSDVTNTVIRVSEEVAAACYGEVIVDLSAMPVSDRMVRLVLDIKGRATKMGLQLQLVGPASIGSTLKNYSDTSDVPLFPSIDDAQRAA